MVFTCRINKTKKGLVERPFDIRTRDSQSAAYIIMILRRIEDFDGENQRELAKHRNWNT